MKSEDCAWAAGFYDGEGHTALAHTRQGTPAVYLTANQAHKEPLLRLKVLFGGNINGPYRLNDPNRSPIFRWQLSRYEPVKLALGWMWPYLGSVKRAQAELALAKVKRSKETIAIRGPKCGHNYDRVFGKDRRCWQCTQKNNKRNYQKNREARLRYCRNWALAHPESRKRSNDKSNARRKAEREMLKQIRLKLA